MLGGNFFPLFFKNEIETLLRRNFIGKLHSKKDIDKALQYAIQHGWKYETSQGHPAGILMCTHKNKCHRKSIPSTPKNTGTWAKKILRWVDECK